MTACVHLAPACPARPPEVHLVSLRVPGRLGHQRSCTGSPLLWERPNDQPARDRTQRRERAHKWTTKWANKQMPNTYPTTRRAFKAANPAFLLFELKIPFLLRLRTILSARCCCHGCNAAQHPATSLGQASRPAQRGQIRRDLEHPNSFFRDKNNQHKRKSKKSPTQKNLKIAHRNTERIKLWTTTITEKKRWKQIKH